MTNMINHPQHYTQACVQLEPIDVLRYAPFDLGNALKYIIRAGHKDDELEDLKKAKKYLEWAIEGEHSNFKPYQRYLNRYGLLLRKFEVFEGVFDAYTSYDYFTKMLQHKIETRIKELEK